MFKNLLSELTKNNMKISDVAALLNVTEHCLMLKLSGKKEFKIIECLKIQHLIGNGDLCLDYLFKRL